MKDTSFVGVYQSYDRENSCEAYKRILTFINPNEYPEASEVYIYAKSAELHVGDETKKIHLQNILRFFADLTPTIGKRREIPVLPESGSDAELILCEGWLRVCDSSHRHIESYLSRLPTRVIDVGEDNGSNYIHLRITNGDAHGLYIDFSHRWQTNTPVTTTANLDYRRNRITLDCLPKAYRNAAHITRKLGIRFLWIDSLCIIQKDRTDWESEAVRMGEVFAFAYCTIAIYPPKEASGSFEEDVKGGVLSRRGWILQERALSRRTIHVVEEQMHWEWVSVVWNKASDKSARPRNALGSSLFPKLDGADQPEDALSVFQSTFTLYSGLEITVKTDKPVALAILEFRLDNHYNTKSVYGIVRRFLRETLFWWRSGSEWMKPLFDFEDIIPRLAVMKIRVPSWSWMSYTGKIQYATFPTSPISWRTDEDIIFHYTDDSCILKAPPVQLSSDCRFTPHGDMESNISNQDGDVVGWIRYDCEDRCNIESREYITLGEG